MSSTTIEGFAVTLSKTQYALLMTALVVAETQVSPEMEKTIEELRQHITTSFEIVWGDN